MGRIKNNESNALKKNSGVIEWPSKRVRLEELKPYERNPREISSAEYERLKDKIIRLGFSSPILATHDLRIVSGHQRLKVLAELGVKDIEIRQAPYEMTDAQFEEALIEANISDGRWNLEMLRADFEPIQLAEFGFDLKLLGNISNAGATDEDETPPIASVAVTARGDTWLLGAHRLRCGDSTNPQDVAALLAGASPHLMVTDPPYGVDYDANWRNEPEKLNLSSKTAMKSKTAATGRVLNDHRSDWTEAWALFKGDVAYIWHGERQSPELVAHAAAGGLEPRNLIVWAKSSLVISRGHYHPQHETCWYFVRKGATAHWEGDRKQTTLWEIAKPAKSETGHSTQKPVECMRRPIQNNSLPGDAVYEPFSGSGTTIIAGEMTERRIYAMELEPLYVDMAVRRWQAFTGKEAILEANGDTFATKELLKADEIAKTEV